MMGIFSRPPKFSSKPETGFNLLEITLEETKSFLVLKEPLPSTVAKNTPIPVYFPEITLTTSQREGDAPPQLESQAIDASIATLDVAPAEISIQMAEVPSQLVTQSLVRLTENISPTPEIILETVMEVPAPESEIVSKEEELDLSGQESELPYLFEETKKRSVPVQAPLMPPSPAPTAAASKNADQLEVLKKTLSIREQDVAVTSAQLSHLKDELERSKQNIKNLALMVEDFEHQAATKDQRIESLEREVAHAGKGFAEEIEQLKFDLKSKTERVKFLEEQVEASASQYDRLRERVRSDIRKIRMRERELENKLEILKRDSETLISSRESKILELKRRIDVLEFNYDVLADNNEKEKQKVIQTQEKLQSVMRALKAAMGLIDGSAPAESQAEPAKESPRAA